jgi:uncharacterized protein
MKVWIDLSNSPHPLLFSPIARELEASGHEVAITARDNAQTVELARERWPDVDVIGGQSPAGRAAKAATLAARVGDLRRWARAQRPDVALSHNSYAQIVAARLAHTPVVTAMDFEHQPANHLAFRLARTVLVPQAIDRDVIRRQGASNSKLKVYPGLKEEVYLGDFRPDAEALAKLGIARNGDTVVVIARTPPGRAIYHRFDNPLFMQALETMGRRPDVRLVVLARHPEQRVAIEGLGLANCTVPKAAIDSRSLMYGADLVVGAGGTMTREAALMGVPTVTVFAGERSGVDRWLERQGSLRRLSDAAQLATVSRREAEPRSVEELRERGRVVAGSFLDALGAR